MDLDSYHIYNVHSPLVAARFRRKQTKSSIERCVIPISYFLRSSSGVHYMYIYKSTY